MFRQGGFQSTTLLFSASLAVGTHHALIMLSLNVRLCHRAGKRLPLPGCTMKNLQLARLAQSNGSPENSVVFLILNYLKTSIPLYLAALRPQATSRQHLGLRPALKLTALTYRPEVHGRY